MDKNKTTFIFIFIFIFIISIFSSFSIGFFSINNKQVTNPSIVTNQIEIPKQKNNCILDCYNSNVRQLAENYIKNHINRYSEDIYNIDEIKINQYDPEMKSCRFKLSSSNGKVINTPIYYNFDDNCNISLKDKVLSRT